MPVLKSTCQIKMSKSSLVILINVEFEFIVIQTNTIFLHAFDQWCGHFMAQNICFRFPACSLTCKKLTGEYPESFDEKSWTLMPLFTGKIHYFEGNQRIDSWLFNVMALWMNSIKFKIISHVSPQMSSNNVIKTCHEFPFGKDFCWINQATNIPTRWNKHSQTIRYTVYKYIYIQKTAKTIHVFRSWNFKSSSS